MRTRRCAARPLLIPLALLTGCVATPTAHIGPVTGVVLADGTLFACSQAGVRVGDTWIQPTFRVTSIDVHGSQILAGGGDPGESGSVALYTRGGEKLAEATVANDLVYSVAIHPDGKFAAAGCADGAVHLLSLPALEITGEKTKHTAPCRVVRFSPDGKWLATGGLDGLVYLHDLTTGAEHVLKDHTAGIECLIFHDGHLYSGARDGKVRVHDRGRLVRTYQGMRQAVLGLAGCRDRVLAGLRDGRILTLHADNATYHLYARIAPPLFSLTADRDQIVAGTVAGAVARTPHFE